MSLWKRLIEPRRAVNPKVLELEERNHYQGYREGLWPATFSFGE